MLALRAVVPAARRVCVHLAGSLCGRQGSGAAEVECLHSWLWNAGTEGLRVILA